MIPGLGRFPGRGHGNPVHYSCLENPHRQRSLAGYISWGHKESDMTEWPSAAPGKKYKNKNELKNKKSFGGSDPSSWMPEFVA